MTELLDGLSFWAKFTTRPTLYLYINVKCLLRIILRSCNLLKKTANRLNRDKAE